MKNKKKVCACGQTATMTNVNEQRSRCGNCAVIEYKFSRMNDEGILYFYELIKKELRKRKLV